MTRLEHSLLYRADWAWQRTEEALLTIRYYWWCAQCATFVVLPMVARRYGVVAVLPVVIDALDVRYRYWERHGWKHCDHRPEPPRSAVDLIIMMRQERARRERALFLEWFDAPPRSDSGMRIVKGTPLHPLTHDDPNPWPSVRGSAPVVYPTEILPPVDEADTALLVPFEWFAPERINA